MQEDYKIEKVYTDHGVRFPRISTTSASQDLNNLEPSTLPTSRVSVDESQTFGDLSRSFIEEFSSTEAKFPIEYLTAMQNLSIVNPDVSQMVDNIIQLGNTGHKIVVETESDFEQERIRTEISEFSEYAFRFFGGANNFVNSVLGQVARTGATSVEWVVQENLDGIEKVVFVPVSTIRFYYDNEVGEYVPKQKVNNIGLGRVGVIALNPHTYQYCALQMLDNSPYAIPPILAALEPLMIQRDIMKNFKFVAKKMGLLGFVSFLISAPRREGGETDEAFLARCRAFLKDQADVLKHNYRDGFAVGFKGNMEVDHHSLMGNAQGAKDIFQSIEEQVFSGLKGDPALHGRTYSTTETYAGVVYEKMLSMLSNYQRTVRSVLEYGFKLHLTLKGFSFKDLYVEFEASKSLSAERDEDTYSKKLDNLEKLYTQGIIDQDMYAQEAGYETPVLAEPRVPSFTDQPTENEAASNKLIMILDKSSGRYKSRWSTRISTIPAYTENLSVHEMQGQILDEYHSNCSHNTVSLAAESDVSKFLKRYVEQYFSSVYPKIKASRTLAIKSLDELFGTIDTTTLDSEYFSEIVFDKFAKQFDIELDSTSIDENIRKRIVTMHNFFRLKDISPFGKEIPITPKFDLVDRNAIRFMRNSDRFYFGRYVTEPKTQLKLKKWIQNEFLQSGRSLRDRGEFSKFRQKFGNTVAREDFKILRVVETSVSRAKNWGNILNVQQAGGKTIEITGPQSDNLICDWCTQMVGKQFSVQGVYNHVKQVIDSDPADLPNLSPFVVSKYQPDQLKDISEDQLLAAGISLPPYHPHCRHEFVVISFN